MYYTYRVFTRGDKEDMIHTWIAIVFVVHFPSMNNWEVFWYCVVIVLYYMVSIDIKEEIC